jgi:hypothetical protein
MTEVAKSLIMSKHWHKYVRYRSNEGCVYFSGIYTSISGEGGGRHTSPTQHPEEAGSRFLRKAGTHMQEHN